MKDKKERYSDFRDRRKIDRGVFASDPLTVVTVAGIGLNATDVSRIRSQKRSQRLPASLKRQLDTQMVEFKWRLGLDIPSDVLTANASQRTKKIYHKVTTEPW